jgi:hypothetical protein
LIAAFADAFADAFAAIAAFAFAVAAAVVGVVLSKVSTTVCDIAYGGRIFVRISKGAGSCFSSASWGVQK